MGQSDYIEDRYQFPQVGQTISLAEEISWCWSLFRLSNAVRLNLDLVDSIPPTMSMDSEVERQGEALFAQVFELESPIMHAVLLALGI